jgi:hypothetical protein
MSVKNRCYGCENFDGYDGAYKGNNTLVQCDLGKRGVLISKGCSNYTPDSLATCKAMSVCYYNKKKSFSDIECTIHGNVGENRKYCRDHAALDDDFKPAKKGGCFVTTAVCEILGKDDNCSELETMRNFRDGVLLRDNSLKNIVSEYYEVSPEIARNLKKMNNKEEFSRYLLERHISIIIKEIEISNNDKAIELYKIMLDEIVEKSSRIS